MAKPTKELPKYVTCIGCVFLELLQDFKGHGFCSHRAVKMVQVIETPQPMYLEATQSNKTNKGIRVTKAMKARANFLKKLPVSDWHQIFAFEKIVSNYLNMERALKENA